MAPIRRYLRITKQSILEVRIYLDNPADAQRWLLNPRDPVLPRVIEAVRPLVLPKLREENERNAKGKPGKRRGVKDIVVRDDFDVSIFLTEISTRHSILTKRKHFRDKKPRLGSTAAKMTGTALHPMDVDNDASLGIRVEEEEEEGQDQGAGSNKIPPVKTDAREGSQEALFMSEGSEDENDLTSREEPIVVPDDDKKKLAMDTTYEGFSIYGRILCLVVKRKGLVKGKVITGGTGQAMMENFITSTQAAKEGQIADE